MKRKNFGSRSASLAIAVGGGVAGILDLLQACIQLGWDIPLTIAGGVLGSAADNGGPAIYALGVVLHFFIALSAAGVYYAASRKLPFLVTLRPVLWRYGETSDAFDRPAAVGASRHRSVSLS